MPTEDIERLMILFNTRLKELMDERGVNQVELSLALGLSRSTVNKWIKNKAIPRMGVIDKIASYFAVPRSYLLEECGRTDKRVYYLHPETAKIAQELYDNPDMKILFDAAQDSTPEDLQMAAAILQKLKNQK